MGLACLVCGRAVAQNSFGECCGFSPPITHRTETREGLRVKCPHCGWWQLDRGEMVHCDHCDMSEMPSIEQIQREASEEWR